MNRAHETHDRRRIVGGKTLTGVSFTPLESPWRTAALAGIILLAVALLAGCGGGGDSERGAAAQEAPTEDSGRTAGGAASDFDAATRDDEGFNRTFRHEFAEIDGVRMHYVIGGEGPPLVLLHGWPQTWYEWIEVMPALAAEHTVIAADLPGLGDSEGDPPSYDKRTLARYVHGLVSEELGHDRVYLAAHDLGAGVGYQYAAQYPDEVEKLAHMDYPLPGPAIDAAQLEDLSWHFALHYEEELPEMLTEGREREYLAHFYPEVAASPDSISDEAVDEFARTYSKPGNMRAGFELYRTLDEDTRDNVESAETPLGMPVLVMSGLDGPAGGGATEFTAGTVRPVAQDVRNVGVPNAGHWLAEENPEFVARELIEFFGS